MNRKRVHTAQFGDSIITCKGVGESTEKILVTTDERLQREVMSQLMPIFKELGLACLVFLLHLFGDGLPHVFLLVFTITCPLTPHTSDALKPTTHDLLTWMTWNNNLCTLMCVCMCVCVCVCVCMCVASSAQSKAAQCVLKPPGSKLHLDSHLFQAFLSFIRSSLTVVANPPAGSH